MLKLSKLNIWITIVLLSCSISLYGNDNQHFSTGEVVSSNDSVLIAYDDLRIVNSKLIELDYEKQINAKLRQVIVNDSIVIKDYEKIYKHVNTKYTKAVKQRNICFSIGSLGIISTIIVLLAR